MQGSFLLDRGSDDGKSRLCENRIWHFSALGQQICATRYEREMSAITGQPTTRQAEEYRKSSEIEKFVRGSRLRGPSSIDLGWNGFAIERHYLPEGERPEKSSDHHFIALWEAHSCHGERADPNGRFIPFSRRPGAVSLFTAGVIGAVRNLTKMEVIVGALSPSLVNGIEQELDRHPIEPLHEKLNFQDAGLRMLLSLLITESEAGGPFGRLYADSLVHALATRFVQLGRAIKPPERSSRFGLPGHLLRRVLERMNSEFSSDLSLATLAAESGYSRAHFLRMFRDATGQTPHRYLLSLRLENAVRMMKERSTPLIDIAVACGFSSHTQFTKAFRSKFGVLPSLHRRDL
jgi:AraC family transcriptional regulator